MKRIVTIAYDVTEDGQIENVQIVGMAVLDDLIAIMGDLVKSSRQQQALNKTKEPPVVVEKKE